MRVWDRSKALVAFENLKPSGTNAALAVYWLSLWRGDKPPGRGDFNPAQIKDLLPAVALTEVRADGAAVCRLSGQYIDIALGGPLRGVNMLALVDGEKRRLRGARLNALVDGGIALSRTRYDSHDGRTEIAETLQLPFFGTMEDGSRQYLSHTDWRPQPGDLVIPRARLADGMPHEYAALPLA